MRLLFWRLNRAWRTFKDFFLTEFLATCDGEGNEKSLETLRDSY